MRRRERNREAFAEPSYWQSYSDMMAALLLIFVLMIAITLAIYRQKTNTLEKTQLELNAAKNKLDIATEELIFAQADLDAYRQEIEDSKNKLEISKAELEDSLLKLQAAYDKAALTQDELAQAYLEIDTANAELAATRDQLQAIVGIRTDIIGELQNKFSNTSMQVDPQNGSIRFSSDVLFEYGKSNLTEDSMTALRQLIPMYLDVLLQDNYRPYIAEIIIEGHTDTSGSYTKNMELSSARAYEVAKFCLDSKNGLSELKTNQLQNMLTVNGRSFSSPVYKANGEIDMEASRRVEIKFRLKEDEMIDKITELLNQQGESGQPQ